MRRLPLSVLFIGLEALALDGGVEATMLSPTPDVLIDPAFDATEREHLVHVAAQGLERVAEALGPRRGPIPLTIYCKREASDCALAFAGTGRTSTSLAIGVPADGASYVPTRKSAVVLVEPSTDVLAFTAHEQTHVEVFHRLGRVEVPQWFSEGAAIFVSRQPCAPGGPGIDDLTRLRLLSAWSRFNAFHGAGIRIYCQAGVEVGARLSRERTDGGAGTPLATLVDALAAGTPFDEVYGPVPSALARRTPVFSHGNEVGMMNQPFTVAVFVRPERAKGTLAWLSSSLLGNGACAPLLGFSPDGSQLVAQWYLGGGADASFFAGVRTAPLPTGRWSHLTLTRSLTELTLYIDGRAVGSTPASKGIDFAKRGHAIITWGSANVSGVGSCFLGQVDESPFPGLMTGMVVLPQVLSAAEVASLAEAPGLLEAPRAPPGTQRGGS
jgi:hypothetical protein